MSRYRVQDGQCGDDFDAADDDAAIAYAEEWLRTGSWDRSQTVWLEAHVLQIAADGTCVEPLGPVRITLPPEEPPCISEAHAWRSPHGLVGGIAENPGVWGHGGGVRIKEVCEHCGRYKVTDTWATNPCDGSQGHTSVEYLQADAESLEFVSALCSQKEDADG